MTNKTLIIYFDFLSPFSYFLCQKIFSFKDLNPEINIEWKPVVLAKLLTHWGIKAPAEVQPKREYLFRQCLRYAAKNRLPFKTPAIHPFNPLYSLRLACRSVHENLLSQEKTIQCLWSKIWGQGCTPDNPEELISWLNEAQLPGQLLLENSYQKYAKDQLKENTQEAIEKKVFGVPSVVAQRDLQEDVFWGNDAWDDILAFINNQDLLDRASYQQIVNATILGTSARLQL